MKKKGLISLLLLLVMAMSVFLASCGGPKTIEEYISKDSDAAKQVQEAADTAGLGVEFSGNDVIYTYDISTIDGVTEEVGKSDMMIEQLGSALDSQGNTFIGLCKQLEEESKIEGVQIIIKYMYGDELLVTKTFNSSGAVNQ